MSDSCVMYSMLGLRRYWPVLAGGVFLMLAVMPSVYDAGLPQWMFNTTSSLPKGLYRLHQDGDCRPLNAGDIAVYSIPSAVLDLVIARRYLDPDHALMKPVAAVTGDHVCTDNRQVLVNGWAYGRVRETDSVGRPLPWFRFCGTVAEGLLYMFINDDRSFDSRHYGPVKEADILGRATPLWTL